MRPEYKVFRAFYTTKEAELYFNQLKELTKLSDSSLSNTLKKMQAQGLIKKMPEKSNTYYGLKDRQITALRFAEFDIETFNGLNRDIRVPLKDFIKKSSDNISFILLFGSSSRKKETSESDIDLLIVINRFSDKKLQKTYEKTMIKDFGNLKKDIITNHNISLIFADVDEFKISKDHLIRQARETGFPINNHQNYYGVMLNED